MRETEGEDKITVGAAGLGVVEDRAVKHALFNLPLVGGCGTTDRYGAGGKSVTA